MTLEGTAFSHYRLLSLIGKGGMGEVYLAEDTQIGRQVAAKLIMIEGNQQDMPGALRLFWREATAIARLDHFSILPMYDYGETEIQGFNVAYLILPYRPEGSLSTWLRKRGQGLHTQQLTLKQVVHVIQQASQGLQYAHDRGVMHLDVKPANFLIRSRSEADMYPDLLLSDFGIARLASATSSSSQQIRGTPTYMAPEQCLGQPVIASDQYALAIMAYELLTGRPPFQGPPMSVMFAHIQQQPASARSRNPLVPLSVDQVLQRALTKKPEERFSSVATFAHMFQQAFQGIPENNTLRLLSLEPVSPMPDVASVTPSAADDVALHTPNQPLAESFLSIPILTPIQKKATPFSTTLPDAASSRAFHTSSVPEQMVMPSPSSAMRPPPSAWIRPKRLHLLILVGILLLILGSTTGILYLAGFNQKATVGGLTATVPVDKTATIIAQKRDLYTRTTSMTPTLSDPLRDNSKGNWDVRHDNGGACSFTNEAYHVYANPQYGIYCYLKTPFIGRIYAFQVQMAIIKSGARRLDGGFFFVGKNNHLYNQAFFIGLNGNYAFGAIAPPSDNTPTSQVSAFDRGLGQTNQITLIVSESVIDLYINGQYIASTSHDSSDSSNLLGFITNSDTSNSAEVAYSNAKLWNL